MVVSFTASLPRYTRRPPGSRGRGAAASAKAAPPHRPAAIVRRVTDHVAGDRLAVAGGQTIPPVGVPPDIGTDNLFLPGGPEKNEPFLAFMVVDG